MRKGIAVLGASGFLGTSLVKRLNQSYQNILACDLLEGDPDQEYLYVDVENLESLEQIQGVDCIINLAAVHRDDVNPLSRYFEVNVQGAINICETARRYQISKIIFTSSVAIYGFAPPDTDESGKPNYFNEYGRTKFLAEEVFKEWYSEDSNNRTLIIIRPTVIFGEGNRGNVYNLLKQIASGRFVMTGDGLNKKSMAYVENVSAFLEHSITIEPGFHVYNYIDKPDLDMNSLVKLARRTLLNKEGVGLRMPGFIGIALGYIADFLAFLTRLNLPVSSIRVKKFMGTTQFSSAANETGFTPPVSLEEGLDRTLRYEFLEDNSGKRTFDTE
tara:strand:+ start:5864 stop:6853 length:990 start_codon:yes stop_codon:yes gene_type:complete